MLPQSAAGHRDRPTGGDLMSDDYDVVIVGGGPGGYAAALYGASAGLSHRASSNATRSAAPASTAAASRPRRCLQTAEVLPHRRARRRLRHHAATATAASPRTGPGSSQRTTGVVDKLVGGLSALLKRRKVTVVNGHGRLDGRRRGRASTARSCAAARDPRDRLGAAARSPASSRTASGSSPPTTAPAATVLPERVAVIGGGVIGSRVRVGLHRRRRRRPRCWRRCRTACCRSARTARSPAVLAKALARRGTTVHAGARVGPPGAQDGGLVARLRDARAAPRRSRSTRCWSRSGGARSPTTSAWTEPGIDVSDRGFVAVDTTTMATGRARRVRDRRRRRDPRPGARRVRRGDRRHPGDPRREPVPVDYARVPWVVYTHPEVAWAGLTEAEARAAGHDIEVHKHKFAGNGRAMIIGDTDGMVKVVARKDGPILGFHLVGPWASELLAEGYLAVNWQALPEEVGALHPPAPQPLRGDRRDDADLHRPIPARLTGAIDGGRSTRDHDAEARRVGHRGHGRALAQGGRRGRRVRRPAVRGVHRQGRLRDTQPVRRRAAARSSSPPGETVPVGTPLARIGPADAAVGCRARRRRSRSRSRPPAEEPPRAAAGRTRSTLPKLGESVTEGTVGRWLKRVGEPVAFDDPLLRGLHRQGRLRDTQRVRRRAAGDPRPGGADRAGRHSAGPHRHHDGRPDDRAAGGVPAGRGHAGRGSVGDRLRDGGRGPRRAGSREREGAVPGRPPARRRARSRPREGRRQRRRRPDHARGRPGRRRGHGRRCGAPRRGTRRTRGGPDTRRRAARGGSGRVDARGDRRPGRGRAAVPGAADHRRADGRVPPYRRARLDLDRGRPGADRAGAPEAQGRVPQGRGRLADLPAVHGPRGLRRPAGAPDAQQLDRRRGEDARRSIGTSTSPSPSTSRAWA